MFLKKIYSFLNNPSRKLIYLFNIAQKLNDKKIKVLPKLIERYIRINYGSYIHLNAKIHPSVKFMHINGIVIGEGVLIEENVVIYQQVTLGGKEMGDGMKGNYPTIKKNSIIFSGAKILGDVTIGENSVIGANSVVNKNVPKNSVFAGVPARFIKENSNKLGGS